MTDILATLNPAQAEAVRNYDSAALIIAGAGSGKTRVLTSRIAYMIQQGVAPESILALTFTNKAAAEMRERIATMVDGSRRIMMGTFHSVFLRILRAEAERIGFDPNFTIYDTTDSVAMVKSIVKELGLGDESYKPKQIFGRISRLKNELITPGKYAVSAEAVAEDRARHTPMFGEIFKRYEQRCKANSAMDFDDMLLYMNILLSQNADTLAKYQELFRYILVDEYQDTNYAQYVIVKMLGSRYGNVCVVGDDSQSIYSFRGARIENIHGFKQDFPAAKIFKLEQNYRSTQTIVNAANSIINHNSQSRELAKECFSEGAKGEPIRVIRGFTDTEEAELVATDIRSVVRDGASYGDVAILYRVNARSRVLEDSLRRRDIPYKIYRGHSFFDRKEVKDLVAYLRIIVNPKDDEALKRIINFPARGIGDVSIAKIESFAKAKQLSMWEVFDNLDYEKTKDKTLAKKVAGFTDLIRSLSQQRMQLDVFHFGQEVAVRSGLVAAYKTEESKDGNAAVENIYEVLNSMETMREERSKQAEADGIENPDELTIEDWLQNVALMTDMDSDSEDDDTPKVTLMTVHSSKGLEFGRVYIVGVEEEQFPGPNAELNGSLEEERRLFYVAVTRAKTAAVLSYCTSRFAMGQQMYCHPSRFISEIDERYISQNVEGFRGNGGMQKPQPRQGFGQRGNGFGQHGALGQRFQPHIAPKPEPRPVQQRPTVVDDRFRKIGVRAAEPTTQEVPQPVTDCSFSVGQRVLHAKFGSGTITAIENMAGGAVSDLKISVQFRDPRVGLRTLLSKFAKLQVIE